MRIRHIPKSYDSTFTIRIPENREDLDSMEKGELVKLVIHNPDWNYLMPHYEYRSINSVLFERGNRNQTDYIRFIRPAIEEPTIKQIKEGLWPLPRICCIDLETDKIMYNEGNYISVLRNHIYEQLVYQPNAEDFFDNREEYYKSKSEFKDMVKTLKKANFWPVPRIDRYISFPMPFHFLKGERKDKSEKLKPN